MTKRFRLIEPYHDILEVGTILVPADTRYGLARTYSRVKGVEYVTMCLPSEAAGPHFTMPASMLEEVIPRRRLEGDGR